MEVKVLSLSQCNFYEPKENSAIVRITDGGYELQELPYNYKHELILSFYDIEPRVGLPSNWNWFNRLDGERVVKFFDEIEGCEELVIHCHAGVSRSPAIAISYGWYKDDDTVVEQIKNGKYLPNRHVLEIMSRLIFDDRRIARNRFNEIVDYYKKLVEESENEKIKF